MAINLSFLLSKRQVENGRLSDLDHLDGLSISVTSASLYNNNRDDLVLFYFVVLNLHLCIRNQR